MGSFFRHPNYLYGDKKINKSNFHKNKKVFNIYDT